MNYKNLLEILEERFKNNMDRHPKIEWLKVENLLKNNKKLLSSLIWMEESGGEVDLVLLENGSLIYVDMIKESPIDRRSLCYDKKARLNRKKNPPKSSVEEECILHDVNLVDEKIYFEIQNLYDIDLKTSTWLKAPEEIRNLGGAIFGDKRYGRTFIYHNGADSYYSSRGFRAYLDINL